MQELANTLIDNGAQCWACPVFDNLFTIISNTAAAVYQRFTMFSVMIFCVLLAFYILSAFWQNLKGGASDSLFQKSIRPILIKSLVALSLLSAGLMVPKLISAVTLEPVAEITLQFSKTMLPENYAISENYQAIKLDDNGFFNPNLRDTILRILETSVSNFQVFIKTGIAITDSAFSISALTGIGPLIRHILICFIGIFLTYYFAKFFIKYSFFFMDIIVAMAMFAFFFPISVVLFIFKDASGAPGWMKNLGGNLGAGQIKKLINAIVSIASAILTYTVIMLIIRGYLDSNGIDPDSIQNSVESFLDFELDNSDASQITFAGAAVLICIINYIAEQVPKITEQIMSAFGIKQEDSLSKEMGENVLGLTGLMANNVKSSIKTVINPESKEKKEETKSEDKKEEK